MAKWTQPVDISRRVEHLEDRTFLSSFPVSFNNSVLPTGAIVVSTDTQAMSDSLSSFFQTGTGSVSVTGDIEVLDQTLHGSFTFTTDSASGSTVVSIAASGVTTAFDGADGNLISMSNGLGAFVITSSGFAGELDVSVTDNVPGIDVGGDF
ncbi:MAG: hypothetical protein NT013_24695 [Planctomycetia bacterium]|nr:hypothetical protein [Planctomycetia bacterium]